jgi:hypothetical protein
MQKLRPRKETLGLGDRIVREEAAQFRLVRLVHSVVCRVPADEGSGTMRVRGREIRSGGCVTGSNKTGVRNTVLGYLSCQLLGRLQTVPNEGTIVPKLCMSSVGSRWQRLSEEQSAEEVQDVVNNNSTKRLSLQGRRDAIHDAIRCPTRGGALSSR